MSRGLLKVHNRDGDSEHRWDTADPASVREAEEIFKAWMAKGHLAIEKDAGQLRVFDPDAKEVHVVRPLNGG